MNFSYFTVCLNYPRKTQQFIALIGNVGCFY